jgi:hypothetical protein
LLDLVAVVAVISILFVFYNIISTLLDRPIDYSCGLLGVLDLALGFIYPMLTSTDDYITDNCLNYHRRRFIRFQI